MADQPFCKAFVPKRCGSWKIVDQETRDQFNNDHSQINELTDRPPMYSVTTSKDDEGRTVLNVIGYIILPRRLGKGKGGSPLKRVHMSPEKA